MAKISQEILVDNFSTQVSLNHRTVLVLVGKGSKKAIPELHNRLCRISNLNDIVWCYKNAETEKEKESKKAKLTDEDDDFCKWIKTFNPEYILYKEATRILGRTCDMLILEDFEALTPNIIASCMETVRGGGLILLVFDQEKSLQEIVHKKSDLVSEASQGASSPRFNRRLFKLLANSQCAMFLDAKLKIMDICGSSKVIESTSVQDRIVKMKEEENEHPLLNLCKTEDQKRTLQDLINLILENRPSITSITAARGRGKSASLGFSIVEAVERGFSLVFLSALFLENVQTIFEFVVAGLKTLGYRKSVDYKVTYTFEKKRRLISRIDITKGLKRSVEYVHPFGELKYYPNLLVIDEAASIPLDYLKKLLDVKFVFLASTVSGYEGTGRVFRTKLQDYIKDKSIQHNHLSLSEPIRYGTDDPVEAWLNTSLVLEPSIYNIKDCPIPSDCVLMHVSKDTLFSGASKTEEVLKELFSLFIASHYRNSPNDMQILSDSPQHEIFALLTAGSSPRIACAIQIAFEGCCDKNMIHKAGNLIPWVLYDNFRDERMLSSLGVRIVRIAVHPNLISMGYGSVAVNLIKNMFLGDNTCCTKNIASPGNGILFCTPAKLKIPKVEWIGSSFGVTEKLLNFWKKAEYCPLCIKQSPSKATGEFSAVVIQGLSQEVSKNIGMMQSVYVTRFISLLPVAFRDFSPTLVLSLIYSSENILSDKKIFFTADEKSRLILFARGLLDLRSILDVLPDIAKLSFFRDLLRQMPVLEQSILIMLGCQLKTLEDTAKYFSIEEFRVVNLVIKAVGSIINDGDVWEIE